MGGSASIHSVGNVGISSSVRCECGRVVSIRTNNVTFSSVGNAGPRSTVANASGKKLRVFYHKQKIKLEDLLQRSNSDPSKMVFKPNTGMEFVDLPLYNHFEVIGLEKGLASIFFIERRRGEAFGETISLNYELPHGCIVTANKEIKIRKSGAGVWIDEDGEDHYI